MALGFIFNKNESSKAYLRVSWNILDFVIVITSMIDLFIYESAYLKALKAFRALKVLIVIRVIKFREENKLF